MAKLEDLLNKEVTRKQFLATILLAITTMLGISTLIGVLTKESSNQSGEPGYGEQHYGR